MFSGSTKQLRLCRAVMAMALPVILAMSLLPSAKADTVFRRVATQYIAALGDPGATSGTGAETWGIWQQDPGPRGVWLSQFGMLQEAGGFGPGNWQFDADDWWLDENGLIMEQPDFPLPPGKYAVTGARETVSVLTIHETGPDGKRRWELSGDATLYDVTHLDCRSARYTPISAANSCTPQNADPSVFKVTPGEKMPDVSGCNKLDYTVLIVFAVAVDN